MFNIYHHKAGVLIVDEYSYGVKRNTYNYYFVDCHTCGTVCFKAGEPNVNACVIKCYIFDDVFEYETEQKNRILSNTQGITYMLKRMVCHCEK